MTPSPMEALYAQVATDHPATGKAVFKYLLLHRPHLAMHLVQRDPHLGRWNRLAEWLPQMLPRIEGDPLSNTFLDQKTLQFDVTPIQHLQDAWLIALHQEGVLTAPVTWADPDNPERRWTGPIQVWAVAHGRTEFVQHLLHQVSAPTWQTPATSDDPAWPAAHAATWALRLRRWDLLDRLATTVGPFSAAHAGEQAWVHVNARHGRNFDLLVSLLQRLGQLPDSEERLREGLPWQQKVAPQGDRRDRHWESIWNARLGQQALATPSASALTPVEEKAVRHFLDGVGKASLDDSRSKEWSALLEQLPLERASQTVTLMAPGDQPRNPTAHWSLLGAYALAALARLADQNRLEPKQYQPLERVHQLVTTAPDVLSRPIEQGTLSGYPCTLTLQGLMGALSAMKAPDTAPETWRPTTPEACEHLLETVYLAHRRWQAHGLLRRLQQTLLPDQLRKEGEPDPLAALSEERKQHHRWILAQLGCDTQHAAALDSWNQWLQRQPDSPALTAGGQRVLKRILAPVVSPSFNTANGLPEAWGWKSSPWETLGLIQTLTRKGATLSAEHSDTLNRVLTPHLKDVVRWMALQRAWQATTTAEALPDRTRPRLRS
jgi:hypothetical protein